MGAGVGEGVGKWVGGWVGEGVGVGVGEYTILTKSDPCLWRMAMIFDTNGTGPKPLFPRLGSGH